MIDFSQIKIYLFYGRKGSGKSLFLSILVLSLLKAYYRVEKRYPKLPHRKFYINIPLAEQFENKELGKHFEYWTHPEQLYNVRDSDIIWDEIGKDLPAGSFAETPKEIKQIFSHLRKRGNRLFANTQVYEDIDIAFRRQVDYAWRIKKLFGSRDISATLPPPKRVWGLLSLRQFDPAVIEYVRNEEARKEIEFIELIPQWFWIRRKYVDLYDTASELPPYQATKLREIVLICREGENCKKKDKHGNPHMIIHHEPV